MCIPVEGRKNIPDKTYLCGGKSGRALCASCGRLYAGRGPDRAVRAIFALAAEAAVGGPVLPRATVVARFPPGEISIKIRNVRLINSASGQYK